MSNWYFRKPGGAKTGPYNLEQVRNKAKKNPTAQAMLEGAFDWRAVSAIAELGVSEASAAPPAPSAPSPTRSSAPRPGGAGVDSSGSRATVERVRDYASEGVDYRIFGSEMQFVEVELDPGESVVAEAGAMMYKHPKIEMQTIFGDGSESPGGGFWRSLAGAGRRIVTGESLFTTVFTHTGVGKAHVSFASPYPGTIIPYALHEFGGEIICQKDAFLCASKGVAIGIHFSKKIMTGLFGGEGFILQKLTADRNDRLALGFVHAGGAIIQKRLSPGEVLEIDTGCLVAMTPTIDFDIRYVGGLKSAFFGGEGLFFGTLRATRGEGTVWLQSLPFARLAGRVIATARGGFGSRQGGEGSLLGGLGDLLRGDNR